MLDAAAGARPETRHRRREGVSKQSTLQRGARDAINRGDWDIALGELQQLAALDAHNPALHNQIGDVYLRKNDINNACQHFEKAISLYAALGLHNNAVALCRKVLRLGPTRLEVRYQLARLRLDQGLRAEGAALFEDYLDHVNPDPTEIDALAARCSQIVGACGDSAPVGKILQKLESVGAYVHAFHLVQELAQHATDAGDVAAARRLREKLRSLRVLVENAGLAEQIEAPQTKAPIEVPDRPDTRVAEPHEYMPGAVPEPGLVTLEAANAVLGDTSDEGRAVPGDAMAEAETAAAVEDLRAWKEAKDAAPVEFQVPDTSFDELANLLGEEATPAEEPPPAEASLPVPPPSGNGREQAVWIPDNFTATAEALARGETHNLEDIIDTFREQMAQALGNDAAARYDLGVAYFEMGLYNEAIAEFDAALGQPDVHARALEMIAVCLSRQGRHDEVLELASHDDASQHLGLRYYFGLACEKLGRTEEARHHFEFVASIDADFQDVAARLQRQ